MDQKVILYILIIFLLVLPFISNFINNKIAKKQALKREEYLRKLQVNDEVLLSSGIHGKIVAINDNLLQVMIAENVVIYVELEGVIGKTKGLLFK